MNFETQNTDILIIGSGGAGLFAALHAMKSNPENKITIAVKGLIGKCGCTRMVQGGYNVALASGDSVERHFMDTIIGGKWLPNQDIAWRLCKTAVERIQELENILNFNRTQFKNQIKTVLDFLIDSDIVFYENDYKLTPLGRIVSEVNECNPIILGYIISDPPK